jgi:hypothetical protein
MPDIVVSPFLCFVECHGKQRLSTVQCLPTGLLVDTQHHRSRRWSQVQAHDVSDLLGKMRIPREFRVSCRCGLRRCARQRSATYTWDTSMPSCRFRYFAICELDRCDKPVCSGGLVLLTARIRARTPSSCASASLDVGIPRRISIQTPHTAQAPTGRSYLRHQPTPRSAPPNGSSHHNTSRARKASTAFTDRSRARRLN